MTSFTPILAHAGLNNWSGWHTLGLLLSLILYPFFKVLIPHSLLLGSSCSLMTRLSQPVAVLLPTVLLYVLLRTRSISRRHCILLAVVLSSSLTLITNLIGDRGYYQWAWDRDLRSGSIALLEQGDTAKAFSKRLAAGCSTSRLSASISVFVRKGNSFHEVEIPPLTDPEIPKKYDKDNRLHHWAAIGWWAPASW